jgi:phosphatidylserine/phosphatidylglycerophosphate/cardiolipin synthase-like enzyme
MRFSTFILVAALALSPAVHAQPAPAIHFAPTENLEHLDVGLISGARTSIDMAAYVLTSIPVIQALQQAAQRGVRVRLVQDRTMDEAGGRTVRRAMGQLLRTPGVEARNRRGRAFMHLKAYVIDGAVLRTGAANFSGSGLKRQDNDLLVLPDAPFARAFEAHFARMWEDAE